LVLAHFRSACVLQCCAMSCACSYGCSYVGSRLHSAVMPPSELRMRWHQKASFRGARLVSAPVVACGACLSSCRSVDRARLTSSARVGHSPQALKVRRVRWLSMPNLFGDSGAHGTVSGEWLTLDFPAEVVAPLPGAEASASSAQLVRPCGWRGAVSPCACSGNNGAARRLLLASRTCQASPSSAGTAWI